MSKELIYTSLPEIQSIAHAKEILKSGDKAAIKTLGLSIGDQCPENEKSVAQSFLLELSESDDEETSANAILGLAYIARRHEWLDKRIVKPYILKALKENEEFKWRIVDAIEYINSYLGWHLAHKKI
jgi:hypothetical protein